MRKFPILVLIAIIVGSMTLHIDAKEIYSESYVVMEAKSGRVLYSKNADKPMWPASITKIMTCALTLLNYSTSDTQEMTETAVFSVPRDSSHIALTPGEIVPVRDLLHATMLQSANEAANGLAEYVSENIGDFSQLMNQTANDIGCKNTSFQNANGLFDKNHITTAYDMALITRWALGVKGFRDLFGKTEYAMQPTNIQPVERFFATKNKLMSNTNYFYEGNSGGKTGWTPESGHTLSTVTKRDGMELIIVLMNAPYANYLYTDATALLDKAFAEYELETVSTDSLGLSSADILSGNDLLGRIAFQSEDISFPRSKSISANEMRIHLNVQESYLQEDAIRPSVSFFGPDNTLLYQHNLKFNIEYTEPDISISAFRTGLSANPTAVSNGLLLYLIISIITISALTVFYNYRYSRIEKEYQLKAQLRFNKKYHR